MTARHITCECQYSKSDLWLQCDQQALREALHNLLANSLKHTPDQGVIRLTVQPAEISRYALLIVEDSGPGIPDHLRDAIWQRRVSLHTHTGGQGIGLAIVRSIVHAHGGMTVIDASPLGGAAVVLTLPLAQDRKDPS